MHRCRKLLAVRGSSALNSSITTRVEGRPTPKSGVVRATSRYT